ncbi:unnamed protein product [Dovyalis caffra]|uniref:Uncharacterized protein n=1 Tax=Dovyalis caffra TaxID=77055 RepID=A0AAV1S9G2_9ROSI|nr:unnamed protein product [Dovyalis caffra]
MHFASVTIMRCCDLGRHLEDNAHLAVVKNTGHAFNVEKPKEFIELLKSFLVNLQLPPGSPVSSQSKVTKDLTGELNTNAVDIECKQHH